MKVCLNDRCCLAALTGCMCRESGEGSGAATDGAPAHTRAGPEGEGRWTCEGLDEEARAGLSIRCSGLAE